MSAIVLLDTSVYLNVLDVPGRNQQWVQILCDFEVRINNGDCFLFPIATILEAGNHISRLSSGRERHQYAERFADDVCKALNGDLPYRPTHFPNNEDFALLLRNFPQYAQRNKSPSKTTEGISLSDVSIIDEWERMRKRHSLSRVLIWSLDGDLGAYDTGSL